MYKSYRQYNNRHKNSSRIPQKILLILFLFVTCYFGITYYLISTYQVDSVSMEPLLAPGNRVVVSPLPYGISAPFSDSSLNTGDPKRGDLVLARSVNTYQVPWYIELFDPLIGFFTFNKVTLRGDADIFSNNQNVLRRVVALPGDTITMKDYIVMIKPEGENRFQHEFRLSESEYRLKFLDRPDGWSDSLPFSGTMDGELTLGEKEYFLLGDYRGNANDSSVFGPVSRSQIVGKILLQYWPVPSLLRK